MELLTHLETIEYKYFNEYEHKGHRLEMERLGFENIITLIPQHDSEDKSIIAKYTRIMNVELNLNKWKL